MHHSTVKPSHSHQGLDSIASRMSASPAKSTITALTQQTPSKSRDSLPGHMTSPTFDFSFERPETDLSTETQKIMDSVREEAARIKAQMLEERNKQEYRDGEADQLHGVGGRKINKPKGKSGRYSDVHRQEFKKMESIASHASLWKNKMQVKSSSIKRSPSKAELDQPEKPLDLTKSHKKNVSLNDLRERLENAAPGKRVKQRYGDDASAARPVSRGGDPDCESTTITPAKSQPHSGLPSAVTTPTKASLARSVSVKQMKTSMIPALSRSASCKTLKSPAMPKTEGSHKYFSSLARFGSMKSILHRSQPKYSNDPTKIAAGTHLPAPQDKLDVGKELPSLPGTPSIGLQRSPTLKRVNFMVDTDYCLDVGADTASRSKIPTPCARTQTRAGSPPTILIDKDPVSYPALATSPNVANRTKIPKVSALSDFTFRAEKIMNFSPSKETIVISPGSTIRHVRPSGVPTQLPPFESLPAIPHGMPNKKRSRPEPDTETEDNENVHPMCPDDTNDDQPRAKKQRMSVQPEKRLTIESPSKGRVAGSRTSKAGGKGRKGLSLARLHMLARPKERH